MKVDKPPVLFVVAAVRFTQAPLSLLHDAAGVAEFRAGLSAPLARMGLDQVASDQVRQFTLVGSEDGQLSVNTEDATVLTFTDTEKTVALTVDPGGVSVRASGDVYVDHDWLFARLNVVLDALASAAPNLRYSRVGFRYADLVLPAEGRQVRDYLAEPFATDITKAQFPDGTQIHEHVQVLVLSTPSSEGRLVVKCFQGVGSVSLPPDLQDAVLSQPPIEAPNGFALLDIDHFIEVSDLAENMSDSTLRTALAGLHLGIRDVFTSVLSEHAKTEWGVSA